MMPIRPEHAAYYRSPEWRALRAEVRARAGGLCECVGDCGLDHDGGRCGVPNGAIIERRGSSWWEHSHSGVCVGERCEGVHVVLTVAHLDHNDFEATADRLRHLCQRCHNVLDAPHRAKRAAQTRRERRERGGQTSLFGAQP